MKNVFFLLFYFAGSLCSNCEKEAEGSPFFHSAPPAVVWGQYGGLYPAALVLTLTVTRPRGLPQPSGVTYGPAPHGKSKNGVR